ncbi:hypothetical protein OJF2_50310 [Aquisphaera giovannonii]|uniref:Uncharacterized protein n=1 Tax=Aquisphaera giovannonii TaxID=406548 RepID=A0A5B9W800_9BACT|nr:hypothetical protein [Aquisphaera giovannonii]QEH36467.1 hypothetical protein OJF2_50310 [Aquisphaera giovannonii]
MSSLKETFEDLNRLECFGFSPTSSSTKPAHIANGWFRRVIGKRYDPVLLNQTVIHWTQNGEINPSEKLLADNPSVFEPFQQSGRLREFKEFRSDLKLLVSPAGGAVNKGNRQSSYNITCEQHLTEDYNDRSVGAFLYHLIATELGGARSPVIDLLVDILKKPKDEVSAITAPLICNAATADVVVGNYPAESVFKKRGKQFQSAVLQNLRVGFDNIADFEANYGGGLEALRRLVAFGVFSVLIYMANRRAELAGTAEIVPQLLYFPDRQRNTAYLASHYTYNFTRQAIESLYTERLRVWLEPRIGPKPTAKKCENFAGELDFGPASTLRQEQFLMSYQSYVSQLTSLNAMAEALRETIFRDLSGTPLDFYRGLGVKLGYLRPAGNNAVRKYYTLEGVLLEAVLASVLPRGETTFRQFLDDIYARYGLITGGRPEDSELLMSNGIGHATVQDLRANAGEFRQQLLSLGWARQFADGVLVVRVPEGFQ